VLLLTAKRTRNNHIADEHATVLTIHIQVSSIETETEVHVRVCPVSLTISLCNSEQRYRKIKSMTLFLNVFQTGYSTDNPI
jgi:hypothetical protein